jgi:hypothetical protein
VAPGAPAALIGFGHSPVAAIASDHRDTDFFLGFVAEYAMSPSWQQSVQERWVPARGGLTSGWS